MIILSLLFAAYLQPQAICDTAFDVWKLDSTSNSAHQYLTCLALMQHAGHHKLDPFILLSTSYEESRLRFGLVSSAEAHGPLQIKHYWCLKDINKCNTLNAGVRALSLLRKCRIIDWDTLTCTKKYKKPRSWEKVLCHYNSGNKCYDSSRRYANRIIHRAKRLKKRYMRQNI